MRGKYRKLREARVSAFAEGKSRRVKTPQEIDAWRSRAAWHMQVIDVRIGYRVLGFDYPMDGDAHPRIRR